MPYFPLMVCLAVLITSNPASAALPGCKTVQTTSEYKYNYFTKRVNMKGIKFEAKASNDVHIALSPTDSDQPDMYEIVIGGGGNTYSAIRRCQQCTNLVVEYTPNFLDSGELRGFWIKYDLITGTVKVGRQSKKEAFMTWTDPSPLDVKYLGYSTGGGSSGEFFFCYIFCRTSVTDTTYEFRYFRFPVDMTRIEFEAKASNDVHIALSSTNYDQSFMYVIVIGGWRNTQSAIRRCKHCTDLVVASTPNILDSGELRGIWITYDLTTGTLKVGRQGKKEAFMSFTDHSPLHVKYLGYSTGGGSSGEFVFCLSSARL